MARREGHPLDLAGVPGSDDLSPRARILSDQVDEVRDLVDMAAVRSLPIAPLLAVNRAEIPRVIGPLVPDADLAIIEPANVGVPAQKPQQLDDDGPEVKLLRGQQRKAVAEIE